MLERCDREGASSHPGSSAEPPRMKVLGGCVWQFPSIISPYMYALMKETSSSWNPHSFHQPVFPDGVLL
jgi:hypothetical protein